MENVTVKTFPGNSYEFLAAVWLQNQDLKGKSAIEISDEYFKALSEIYQKYAPEPEPPRQRKVRFPGIDT